MYNFDVKTVKYDLVQWIKHWFDENGNGCNAVIGISGGIDSSVTAALCVEALGKENVIGVMMPCGKQHDIDDAWNLIQFLNIKSYQINIDKAVNGILDEFDGVLNVSNQTETNLPPRIRMATLYAVSQSVNGRVLNTSNLSESWVGYDTRYGDSVGDLSPLGDLTKTEIRAIGKELGLPEELVNKVPEDGLPNSNTDEQKFGFTYFELDRYIREGVIDDVEHQIRIEEMYNKNSFKLEPMLTFIYNEETN